MNIGIPQEISIEENRVAVTPAGVYELTREGHKVYLESGCGIKSGFSDHDYQQVGGEIVYSHDEVFGRADTIIKVEPPTEEESEMMLDEQTLFSSLHLGMRSATSMILLINKRITYSFRNGCLFTTRRLYGQKNSGNAFIVASEL